MTLASAVALHLFGHTERSHTDRAPALPRRPDTTAPLVPQTAEFVRRLQRGNESALRELITQHATSLIRFANAILRDRTTAESLAYDVLADTWARRAHLDPSRSLIAYLFTSVRRRAWDELERRGVRERYEQRVLSGWDNDNAAWMPPSPEASLLDRDDAETQNARMTALRDALDQLPERRRLVLHLRFEQEMSYPAIGEILGISDKAAQQLVLRTIGALRRVLFNP